MAERHIPLAVALLVLCNAVALGAQTAVAIGTRVRVQAERRYVGTVLALDSSQLMLELDRSRYTQTLPRAAVSALEVSRGRHRDTLRGTGIGLLAGAIGGAFIGLAGSTHSCKPSGYCFQVAEVSVGHNMVMFGGIGAGAGFVIGSLSHRDTWEAAPLTRLAVGVSPLPGARLALTVGLSLPPVGKWLE